jgi:hypothetical protein
MFSVLAKTRTVVSIDLSDDAMTKAVLVSSDGERFLLEGWEYYSEQNNGGADFIQGHKPEAVTVALGDSHTLCFAVPELDGYNLEMEKRKRGVAVETQYSDYLNITRSGMLAAIHRDTADEILKSVKETFPGIPQHAINQSMVALLYAYLRSYCPQTETRAALLHCAGQTVSLLVAQTEMPVWSGSIEIKLGNRDSIYSEISALLQTANEKLGQSRYDMLLLAGDCDGEDVKAMRKFATQVELFSPYRNNAFELARGLGHRRKEAQQEGHRLAVAIGGAGMLLERVGINLADTDLELQREIPIERQVSKEETAISMALGGARQATIKLLPLFLEQQKLIALSLMVAAILFGYRYWEASKAQAKIAASIADQQQRAAALVDIRAKHDEYDRKINAINERSAAIGEIRKNQLIIKTVLDELDRRIPKGLTFSELDVQETDIKIKGYALDRPAVFAFANRLGQSLGIFADVAPTYDDKQNIGNYQITCKYIGPVPVNEIPLPAPSAQPKAKE